MIETMKWIKCTEDMPEITGEPFYYENTSIWVLVHGPDGPDWHPAYYDYNNRHWYPSSGAAIPAKDITHWMLPSIPEEDTNPLPK